MNLWLMEWRILGMEGDDFRCTRTQRERMYYFPTTSLKTVPRVMFDQEVFDKYRYGLKRCFLYLPWLCDVLVENNVLWNYPAEQNEWLQRCINMLPVTPMQATILCWHRFTNGA